MAFGVIMLARLLGKLNAVALIIGAVLGLFISGIATGICSLLEVNNFWSLILITLATITLASGIKSISCDRNAISNVVPLWKGLKLIVMLAYLILALFFIAISITHPFGEWDAWMMWNTKAIHISDNGLQSYFNQLANHISHPGYPLLFPLTISSGLLIAKDSVASPIILAFLFTFLSAGVIWIGAKSLGNRFAGLIALACLAISQKFFLEGTSQYADIPLACLITTIVVFIIYSQKLRASTQIITGILIGMMLHLKNEGLMIFICLSAVWGFFVFTKKWKKGHFLVAMVSSLPFLAILIYYKSLVPSEDHLQAISLGWHLIDQGINNLPLILKYYAKTLVKFIEPFLLIILLLAIKTSA